MKKTKLLIFLFLVTNSNSCTKISKKMPILKIDKTQFGKTMDGNMLINIFCPTTKGWRLESSTMVEL